MWCSETLFLVGPHTWRPDYEGILDYTMNQRGQEFDFTLTVIPRRCLIHRPLRTEQVPVLLDTNVSCPEGINEVLAEDDVSWQLKPVRERWRL